MKMLEKTKFFLLALNAVLFLAACGDDKPSTPKDDEKDPVSIADSISYQDSLYSWFLENRVKREDPDSDNQDSTGVAEEDDGEVVVDTAMILPPAGFYSPFVIPVPAPKFGGEIRCGGYDETVQGYEKTWAFNEPLEIKVTTMLRCSEFVDGEPVRTSTQTYFIDNVTSMPVVAISVDHKRMFDETSGYYSQGVRSCVEPCYEANYWWDLELPVHVEFFENGIRSAGKAWEIDAGLSIIGQWSRYRAKKSVSITMRKQYQDGRLKYPIFKTRPEDKKFKAFNLRNNGNRFVGDYIEDPMLTSLMEGSGVDYQRSRQVVVYYNGEYFGIHDLRERLNEHYIETNYKIDSKEVDMVKHCGDSLSVSGGTADKYVELLTKIHNNDFSGTNNKAYAEIRELMDMGNYADYMSAQIYIHNGDWPDNNVRAWRSTNRPFKFALFDVDHGFGWDWHVQGFDYMYHNMFSWIKRGGHSGCVGMGCFAEIYIKLSKNPDFRRLFANHGAVMLDYYLTYDKVVDATNAMTATIPSSEMDWDQTRFPRRDHSFDRTGATLISYAKGRSETVRNEFRKEFELGEDIKVNIAAEGKGEVRLDDMKLPSTNYTGTFFLGNDMLLEAVPVDGAEFKEWEDGSTKNPRLVSPKDGSSYKAIFK